MLTTDMLTTDIKCNRCNDVISVFGKSVELPFVCGFCKVVDFEEPNTDNPHEFPQPEVPQPKTDAAEPTNTEPEPEPQTEELIADLEEQLTAAKSKVDFLSAGVITLAAKLVAAEDAEARSHVALARVMQQRDNLSERNTWQARQIQTLTNSLIDRYKQIDELKAEVANKEYWRATYSRELDSHKRDNANLRKYLAERAEENRRLWARISKLRDRGLWSRIWNKTENQ